MNQRIRVLDKLYLTWWYGFRLISIIGIDLTAVENIVALFKGVQWKILTTFTDDCLVPNYRVVRDLV